MGRKAEERVSSKNWGIHQYLCILRHLENPTRAQYRMYAQKRDAKTLSFSLAITPSIQAKFWENTG